MNRPTPRSPKLPSSGSTLCAKYLPGNYLFWRVGRTGYVWSFFAGQEALCSFATEKQFDGIRKAAYILAEKTQGCVS